MTRPMESRQLRIPDDPTGIVEPHDVLVAEEFAMPSGPDHLVAKLRESSARGRVVLAAALFVTAFVLARRLRQ